MADKLRATFQGGSEPVEVQKLRLVFLESILELKVRGRRADSKELDAMMKDLNQTAGELIAGLEKIGK